MEIGQLTVAGNLNCFISRGVAYWNIRTISERLEMYRWAIPVRGVG